MQIVVIVVLCVFCNYREMSVLPASRSLVTSQSLQVEKTANGSDSDVQLSTSCIKVIINLCSFAYFWEPLQTGIYSVFWKKSVITQYS